ncbi:putative mitochondrial protein [Tanacetum coccineum]
MGEYQRWVSKLSGYEFEIQYRPRRENGAADTLSRRGEEVELKLTLLRLKINAEGMEGYSGVDGEIRYRGRVVLPRTSEWIPQIFAEFHGGAMAKLVAECGVCQKNKYSNRSPAGLLQPLELPFRVWEDLTMDFVEGLPRSTSYNVVMVVVDRLSKLAHFVPMKHPFTTSSVVIVFIREIVRLYGIPCSIISDRDKIFVSHFWRELFKYQGTVLKRSTTYHPQTDGQSKVVNRNLETYLRCFASEKPKEWDKWLSWAEYWYNTSFHSVIGMTPFKVLYGRDPPCLVSYDRGTAVTTEVDQYLWERDRVLAKLRVQYNRAQQVMKSQADGKLRDVEFAVGDLVYLKLRPYRQVSVAKRVPLTSSIHPIFHVSQLKRVIGDHQVVCDLPDGLVTESPFVPAEVCGSRLNAGRREVLIAWKDMPELKATWEGFEEVRRQFLDFHLEDKVSFRGGSDDADPNRWGRVNRPKNTTQGAKCH